LRVLAMTFWNSFQSRSKKPPEKSHVLCKTAGHWR
jgi:hypothetical protein